MKVSCLPVSFFDELATGRMSLGEWARIGAAAGSDAIDLSILFVRDPSPAGLKRARAEIAAAGMQVKMVTTYPDLTHPDPDERAREREKLARHFAVAAELGAEYVRVTAGQAHEMEREAGLQWAAEGLSWAAETGRKHGIEAVFENHAKPPCWDRPDFSLATENFLEIVRRTAPSRLGVNFDTANTVVDGADVVAVLRQVVSRVVTVHAADTSTTGTLSHTLLGTGLVPFPELFSVLKGAGWDGWICIEEGSKQGPEGVAKAVAFVRRTWAGC